MTPLRVASSALRAGGLVAFPTDTVYGVGALLGDAAAVRRLYALKGRAPGKPVAICVPTAADIGCYAHTCFGSGARAQASGAALAGGCSALQTTGGREAQRDNAASKDGR